MEKSFDLKVESTKEEVIGLLNNAKLPITAMLWIAREVSDMVYAEYQMSLQKQKADYVKALNSPKESEGNENGN